MIGELGQSHMLITGPGADDEADAEELQAPGEAGATTAGSAGAGAGGIVGDGALGDPGLTVRVIEGRPTVTRVRAGSPADRAGLRPGAVVTADRRPAPDGDRRLVPPAAPGRGALRAPARGGAAPPRARRLAGLGRHPRRPRPARQDDPRSRGAAHQACVLGHLPPLYPEVRAYGIGDVGVVAFNIFLVQPVLEDLKRAVARFSAHHVRGIVLDLRGNPGGQGAMAIPVAALFVTEPVTLGTLQFRDLLPDADRAPRDGRAPRFPGRSPS